ncbi:MAG: hypothetical protein Q9174_004200 [Haloplaca sp. 1 TL-2023]
MTHGKRVQAATLGVLLGRLQLQLRSRLAEFGVDGIPGNPRAPAYSFLTVTPRGSECYFFMNAEAAKTMTYGLINETVFGLKEFLFNQRRYEQVVFEVESASRHIAFGGLSVGSDIEAVPEQNDATDPSNSAPSVAGIASYDVSLQCRFGERLPKSLVAQALGLADMKAKSMIDSPNIGPGGLLPGPTGEWAAKGHLGGEFRIVGLSPFHHLTWANMMGAVTNLKGILVADNVRDVTCTMTLAHDVVGIVKVRQQVTEQAVAQQ